jgi:hypothetical protein
MLDHFNDALVRNPLLLSFWCTWHTTSMSILWITDLPIWSSRSILHHSDLLLLVVVARYVDNAWHEHDQAYLTKCGRGDINASGDRVVVEGSPMVWWHRGPIHVVNMDGPGEAHHLCLIVLLMSNKRFSTGSRDIRWRIGTLALYDLHKDWGPVSWWRCMREVRSERSSRVDIWGFELVLVALRRWRRKLSLDLLAY